MEPFIFIIFGATGDLTNRKLLPAMYRLKEKNLLPKEFSLVGIARRDKSNDDFRQDAKQAIKKSVKKFNEEVWGNFSSSIYYFRNDFENEESCDGIKEFMDDLDKKYGSKGNRIFYLATKPEHFTNILGSLKTHGVINRKEDRKYRIIIEKPFGNDLTSAKELNKELSTLFDESEIFRIDHFLGKEAVQNLFAFRFANKIFESVWDTEHIENIQITVAESLGVETRGGYYDNYGATKDMIQNHLLQILSIVAMEPPKSFTTKEIKKEKVNALKKIIFSGDAVFGQYVKGKTGNNYTDESGVKKYSKTETYAAMKLEIKNKRWEKTPFYLRTGKYLSRKASEVVVYFRQVSQNIFKDAKQNVLVVRLQPDEGIYVRFNAKEPGSEFKIQEVSMDFCHECLFGINTPEAYEKLLQDVFNGDSTLFTRWDEVEQAWKIIDPIIKNKEKQELLKYTCGTWGPVASDKMLKKYGHHWREPY